jgi:GNAT superfamily N-acetyltransferase
MDVTVELYAGPRAQVRPLFELAEDSVVQLDSYIDLGRVLVARTGDEILGQLQLIDTDQPGELEVKNMGVLPEWQGHGIGARLIQAALDLARAESQVRVLVATAAADVGNLRFYQRQGFRMLSVERDAFTPETGYPPPAIVIDGIELRDKVWLDCRL